MNLARLRDVCLGLPGATEQVQWGDHIVFKVGGKMFCVAATEPAPPYVCSVKSEGERFLELCEREGVVAAPYLARAQWVAIDEWSTLEDAEFRELLTQAYEIVRSKLPRRVQAMLADARSGSPDKGARTAKTAKARKRIKTAKTVKAASTRRARR